MTCGLDEPFLPTGGGLAEGNGTTQIHGKNKLTEMSGKAVRASAGCRWRQGLRPSTKERTGSWGEGMERGQVTPASSKLAFGGLSLVLLAAKLVTGLNPTRATWTSTAVLAGQACSLCSEPCGHSAKNTQAVHS
jgi:hypothetical protein